MWLVCNTQSLFQLPIVFLSLKCSARWSARSTPELIVGSLQKLHRDCIVVISCFPSSIGQLIDFVFSRVYINTSFQFVDPTRGKLCH